MGPVEGRHGRPGQPRPGALLHLSLRTPDYRGQPGVRRVAGDGETAFLLEHQEIDGNLERVRKATHVHQARELLLAAVAYSRGHFDKEERIVFPMAERVLKNKTLTALGQTWMDQRTRVAV